MAQALERALPVVAPWTAQPEFAGARASLAWVEAQLVLLWAYLDEHGLIDGDGQPRPSAVRLDRLEARASTLRAELGLTPLALAKLLANLAVFTSAGGDDVGLEALRAEGRAIVAACEAVLGPVDAEDTS